MKNKYSNLNDELKSLSNKLNENLDTQLIDLIIGKLLQMINQYKEDIRIYNFLALFYNKKYNYNEAINSCKKGISLFPESAETYYIMADSYFMKKNIQEAIDSYKKAILFNKNHYLSYYSLGNITFSQKKIEEAVSYFKKSIDINPNFVEAQKKYEGVKKERHALITYLTYFNPKENHSNPIIVANQKLQKIKYKFDINKKISDQFVIKLYQQMQKIIQDEKINNTIDSIQIYRESLFKYKCFRHEKIFNTFNVIPEFCFDCYKIQIEPKDVLELFKLFLIFDNLKLHKNLTRKCMIETRSGIKGTYKGLIYCIGLNEAKETFNFINPILNKTISNKIPRKIKRGCSEYELSFPDYNEINDKSPKFMRYNKKWREKEKIIDEKLKTAKKVNIIPEKSLSGITLKDALILNNWLVYAKKIGDDSFNKITKDVTDTDFIDKLLMEKLKTSSGRFFSDSVS